MLYYDYAHEQTSTAGSISYYRYSCNGAYDPDITGSGHQPLGFDTMMTYYEQYTVIASKISVTFVAESGAPMRCVVYLAPDTTNLTNVGDAIENGLVKTKMITGTSGGGFHQMCQLNVGCDIPTYFGRKRGTEIIEDVTLSGTVAANPTEQAYFIVASWAAVNTTTSILGFDVLIEYDVVFWEPRKVAQQ